MPTPVPSKAALATILNHEEPDEKVGVKEPFREQSKPVETKYIHSAFHCLIWTENNTLMLRRIWFEGRLTWLRATAEQLPFTTLLAAYVFPGLIDFDHTLVQQLYIKVCIAGIASLFAGVGRSVLYNHDCGQPRHTTNQ